MSLQATKAYFDSIADKWDGWQDETAMHPVLRTGLRNFGLRPDETVLDLGCGTGILTRALLAELGPQGRVHAVDIAPNMLEKARRQTSDDRVAFIETHAAALPLENHSIHRVVCYSTWPHITDVSGALTELHRVLRPGGMLHIWHTAGRETINGIHTGAGGPIGDHLLVPVAELATVAKQHGYAIVATEDHDAGYLLTARKETTE